MNEIMLREFLNKSFDNHISFRLVKPSTYQLFLPYYHSDGDMIDIFIQFLSDSITLTDFWQTLMRLSYYTDLTANGRKKVFDSILATYNVNCDDEGRIFINFKEKIELFPSVMEMIAVITKVSDISYLKTERVKSLFYEEFEDFVMTDLKNSISGKVDIKKDFSPAIDEKKSYQTPFAILKEDRDPLLLFPVLNSDKCKEAAMALLFYQTKNFKNNSITIFNDMSEISAKDAWKLMDLSDRPFSVYDSDNKGKILSYAQLWSR